MTGFDPDYLQKDQEFQAGLHYLQFGNTDQWAVCEDESYTDQAIEANNSIFNLLWIRDIAHTNYNMKRDEAFLKSIYNIRNAIIYRLTNHIVSNFLQIIEEYSKTISKAQKNIRIKRFDGYKEGVSTATQSAETHMAQAKQRLIAGALAASMAAATAALPGAANAQDAANAAPSNGTVWTEELREFDAAAKAARDHAENNDSVGILIHVGTQAAERGIEHNIGQQIVGWLADPQSIPQEFIDEYCPDVDTSGIAGVEAQYFLRYNDVAGTGVTFHINHLIHGAESGTELKPLIQGICAVPDVAEALHVEGLISSLQEDNAFRAASISPTIE